MAATGQAGKLRRVSVRTDVHYQPLPERFSEERDGPRRPRWLPARARKARRAACLPILPFLAFALPQAVLAQRPEMIRAAGTRPTACVGESGARGTRRLPYFGSSTGVARSPRRLGSDRSWLRSRDANRHLAGNSER